MKRKALLLITLLTILALPTMAAQATGDIPFNLDPAVLGAIVAAGATLGLSQLLKNILKQDTWPEPWKSVGGYGISLVIAAGATAFILTKLHAFTMTNFGLYTIAAWGVANGWWKAGVAIATKAMNSKPK